ncbi:MAG: hypothetical protein Q7S22_04240 [Candidatus Micrarchaeota archaeon]|nr:hypothetical protein [Candidatus Micrarchaeota archaeon]
MKKFLLCLVVLVLLFGCTSNSKNKVNLDNKTNNNSTIETIPTPADYCNGSNAIDIYTEGFVTLANKKFTDHCTSITTLEENYCNESLVQIEKINCPQGYQCYFGKCTPKKNNTCTDSDDSDLFTKGTVELNGDTKTDSCTGNKNIREYSCKDNLVDGAISECPEKTNCYDGRCIRKETTCTDSDGYNISTFGKVTIDDNSGFLDVSDDKCTNNILTEYYCNGNTSAYDLVNCPTLTHCTNGACITNLNATGCTDSDGITREIAGSVVASGILYQDTCVDSSKVLEYYCQGNDVNSATLSCAVISGNSTCTNSRCSVN